MVAIPPTGPDEPVRLEVDIRRRLPGRGAWVHPQEQCVTQAIRRRAFARALRVTGSVDTEGLVSHITSTVREQVHER